MECYEVIKQLHKLYVLTDIEYCLEKKKGL